MPEPSKKESFEFVYKGVEYDVTDYAEKHPGGIAFLKNMKEVSKDITEYFRALHSDEAQKVLKALPIISVGKPSKTSEEYMQLYKKLERYHEPIWVIEILLFLLVSLTWLIGCITEYAWLSIVSFTFVQIVVGWVSHAAVHSRNVLLNTLGHIEATVIGGFSPDWWGQKHITHHIFTNMRKYDQDIQHSYKLYVFPFLYLKWRFDSFVYAVNDRNYVTV